VKQSALGFFLMALLAPLTAAADGIQAGECPGDGWQCRRAPVAFSKEDSAPFEWQFDSGWVPPSGDLQVHLWGGVFATTRVELAGDVMVSWPDALTIETPGHPNGGLLGYHYGVDVGAQGKVQITVLNQTYNWQGDLPYVPQIDFQVEAEKTFDAWGWDPGVSATDSSQPQTVAQIDIAGLIGPSIPGISGGFQLDVALDLTVSYVNERIVIQRADGDSVSGGDVLGPDDASGESYDGGAFLEVDVHPEGTVRYAGVLHLIPAFFVELLGNNSSISLADIPIALPENEQHWVFESERVHAPLPDLRIHDAIIDFGEVRIGDEVDGHFELSDAGEADVRALPETTDPDHFVAVDLAVLIDSGDTVTSTVRFSPSEARSYLAMLELESNDPDEPTQRVLLKGVGIGDDLGVPPSIDTEGGCGCRVVGGGTGNNAPLVLALVLGLNMLRLRRTPWSCRVGTSFGPPRAPRSAV